MNIVQKQLDNWPLQLWPRQMLKNCLTSGNNELGSFSWQWSFNNIFIFAHMAKSMDISQDIIDNIISAVGDDTHLLKQCSLVPSSFLLPSCKRHQQTGQVLQSIDERYGWSNLRMSSYILTNKKNTRFTFFLASLYFFWSRWSRFSPLVWFSAYLSSISAKFQHR